MCLVCIAIFKDLVERVDENIQACLLYLSFEFYNFERILEVTNPVVEQREIIP